MINGSGWQRVGAMMAALALAGCSSAPPGGALAVAVVDGTTGADAGNDGLAGDLVAEATSATLISRNADGEPAPGLATSWRFLDDGSALIMRLAPRRWPAAGRSAGAPGQTAPELAAADVVAGWRQRGGPKPLRAALEAAGLDPRAATRAPTLRVLELSPRPANPHLLEWLAQPVLAVRDRRGRAFPGPYRLEPAAPGTRQRVLRRNGDIARPDARAATIVVATVAADAAITGFAARRHDVVLGAGLAGLGSARAAGQGQALRLEAVRGVIGLSLRSTGAGGTLADPRLRRALLLSADGDALANRIALAVLAAQRQLYSALPAPGGERALPLAERRRLAAALLAAAGHGPTQPLRLRLKVPMGPDHRTLADALAASWAPLGVELVISQAGPGPAIAADKADTHDLVLEEHVATVPDAAAFLARWSCRNMQPCSLEADLALSAARAAGTDAVAREAALVRAEALMMADPAFVPLLRPVRWALVSRRVDGFRANGAGHHPLGHLGLQPPG